MAVVELYRQKGQWAELQQWTTDWIARNPESTSYYSAYAHHLSALVFNDRIDAATTLADQWLMDGRVEGAMTPLQKLRFDAALNFANGQSPNLYFHRIDQRWFEKLAEAARFFVRHSHHFNIVSRCTSKHYFQQSDEADALRGEWLTMLRNESATLSATQLQSLISWTLHSRISLTEPLDDRKQLDATEVPNRVWEQIAATLKNRWLLTEDAHEKRSLSDAIVSIYSRRFSDSMLLPFLRERIAAAGPDDKPMYIESLYDNLLSATWSNEIELEAFALHHQLTTSTDPSERTANEVRELLRLVDAMIANRIAKEEEQVKDQGDLDKLSRRELAAKLAEIQTTVHQQLAARLAEMAERADDPVASWFRIEQVWLDVQLRQNLNEAEAACWQIMGNVPPKIIEDNELDGLYENPVVESATDIESRERQTLLEMYLKRRVFVTVVNLAVRSKAAPASVDRLLKYVDAGIARGDDSAVAWRQAKFRILVALDRPDDLDRELRQWIQTDVTTAPWRQMLARLLAERGKLD